jgi:hypothetical protein
MYSTALCGLAWLQSWQAWSKCNHTDVAVEPRFCHSPGVGDESNIKSTKNRGNPTRKGRIDRPKACLLEADLSAAREAKEKAQRPNSFPKTQSVGRRRGRKHEGRHGAHMRSTMSAHMKNNTSPTGVALAQSGAGCASVALRRGHPGRWCASQTTAALQARRFPVLDGQAIEAGFSHRHLL